MRLRDPGEMFRQQQQSRQQNQEPKTSSSTSTPPWATWLSCICRGRLILKLILGTTVLLLAVNIWPGPQLLSDGDESYDQLRPVAGEVTKFGQSQQMSPLAENQLISPPTESQKPKQSDAKLVKSTATEDIQHPFNLFNKEMDRQQFVKESLKHVNQMADEGYPHIRHFEMEHGDINDNDHVSIPLKKQPIINVLSRVTTFSRPTPSIVRNPAVIFLYSSSTRSGSTVFSEMVSTKNNSILLTEPFKPFLKTPCLKNSSCVNEVLSTSLNCNFITSKLTRHYKYFFIRTSHHEVERCNSQNIKVVKHCLRRLNIAELCKRTPIRILKLVRGKLSDLEVFLKDPNIDSKVIHLIRDPRGTLQSVKSLGWLGNTTVTAKCKHIFNDLTMFDELHDKYPDKIAKFSIEDFSIDPNRIAEEVFRFLYNEKILSLETEKFITTHMKGPSKRGTYNTHKNSQEEYESWRREIGQRLLQEVEHEESCQQAIGKMGHNLFGDIETARNLSYSLFDDSYLYS